MVLKSKHKKVKKEREGEEWRKKELKREDDKTANLVFIHVKLTCGLNC